MKNSAARGVKLASELAREGLGGQSAIQAQASDELVLRTGWGDVNPSAAPGFKVLEPTYPIVYPRPLADGRIGSADRSRMLALPQHVACGIAECRRALP
jgi:hypothetical protein